MDLKQHPASKCEVGAGTQISASSHTLHATLHAPHTTSVNLTHATLRPGCLQGAYGHHDDNERQTKTQVDEVRD